MATFFKTMLGTATIKVYLGDTELQHAIERFEYVYDEEGDDSCDLTFSTLGADSPNLPEFQERAQLRVIWGYLGGTTITRLVTVDDPSWTFDRNGRKVVLKCLNKAVSTKHTRSKKMYTKTKLPDVAKEVAERHGLNAYMEVPGDGDSTDNKIINLREEDWKSQTTEEFREYEQIHQANKTDKQLLEEYGRKEPQGEWLTETRDNALTLKKRNFNKTPLRAYTFEGGNGELFSFSPETKNSSKMGAAMAAISSYWNGLEKKFVQTIKDQLAEFQRTYLTQYLTRNGFKSLTPLNWPGKKDGAKPTYVYTGPNQSEDASVKTLEILHHEANRKPTGAKKNVLGVEVEEYEPSMYLGLRHQEQKQNWGSDNTRVHQLYRREVFGEDLINEANAAFKPMDAESTSVANLHDPTSQNDLDAGGPASNAVSRNNLKRNPAEALVWGDASLTCGAVLSILNVGTKYSGNYWIIKCTHTIESASGYTTALQLSREGSNIKATDNDEAVTKAGKLVNKQIGQDKDTQRKIRIRSEQNEHRKNRNR